MAVSVHPLCQGQRLMVESNLFIAPGEGIARTSRRSQECIGSVCVGTHSNSRSMYMELSGTSQATAVAGGSAALAREYCEVAGINKPSASLIKATLINGAEDLGTPNIPNNNEGWGQIDLETVFLFRMVVQCWISSAMMHESTSRIFLLYSFDGYLEGCRLTLHGAMQEVQMLHNQNLASWTSWFDDCCSGTFYLETISQAASPLQVVQWCPEQHRACSIASEQAHNLVNGWLWSNTEVEVHNATAWLQPWYYINSKADLTTFSNSILPSSTTRGWFSNFLAWHNQGTLASSLSNSTRDITEGNIKFKSLVARWGWTGLRLILRLRPLVLHTSLVVDTSSQVVEISDGVSGKPTASWRWTSSNGQGLRVIFLEDDGTIPQTSSTSSGRKCQDGCS